MINATFLDYICPTFCKQHVLHWYPVVLFQGCIACLESMQGMITNLGWRGVILTPPLRYFPNNNLPHCTYQLPWLHAIAKFGGTIILEHGDNTRIE